MHQTTHLTLAEAIEPHLSVIYSEEAPVDRLGCGQHRDDDEIRRITAKFIAEGVLPIRGGVVRLTSEEVAA